MSIFVALLEAYPEYMDYYWLAAPAVYMQEAKNYIKSMENIGLILYDDTRNFSFIEKPAKNNSDFGTKRECTMDSVVYYLL